MIFQLENILRIGEKNNLAILIAIGDKNFIYSH
jgi:hypothetical protein